MQLRTMVLPLLALLCACDSPTADDSDSQAPGESSVLDMVPEDFPTYNGPLEATDENFTIPNIHRDGFPWSAMFFQTIGEQRKLNYSIHQIEAECMAKAGFIYRATQEIGAEAGTMNALSKMRPLGPETLEEVSFMKNYQPPENLSVKLHPTSPFATELIRGEASEEIQKKFDQASDDCLIQAKVLVGLSQTQEYADAKSMRFEVLGELYELLRNSPEAKSLATKMKSCMASKGYEVDDDIFAFDKLEHISEAYECKKELSFYEILLPLMSKHENDLVRKHRDLYDELISGKRIADAKLDSLG